MLYNSILLVDDDKAFLNIYSKILRHNGYMVETTNNGFDGLKRLENFDVDIVVTDMCMPEMNGLQFIEKVKELSPGIQIIVITGQGTIENAVEAMKKGAFSYLQKPVNIEEFLLEMEKTMKFLKTQKENIYLKEELLAREDNFIGRSKMIINIKEKNQTIATSNSTVLVTGESGTGKELIAKAIHKNSDRKEMPMIKVNCAALSKTILESELFGHEKGAFTGAYYTKKGRFELANGSTLFLDEIGDLPLDMQTKLLRVIQEKEFERVGSTKPIYTDFRLVCATNKDLPLEIKEGRFREDLYYRLNVIPIHLPPLRERCEDIPILVPYFAERFAAEMGKKKINFTNQALETLINYPWPGNIRELKNILERLTVFSKGFPIGLKDLPVEIFNITYNKNSRLLENAKEDFEINFILNALRKNNWNISKTANHVGLARKNLHAKIKKYKLK